MSIPSATKSVGFDVYHLLRLFHLLLHTFGESVRKTVLIKFRSPLMFLLLHNDYNITNKIPSLKKKSRTLNCALFVQPNHYSRKFLLIHGILCKCQSYFQLLFPAFYLNSASSNPQTHKLHLPLINIYINETYP